MSVRSIKNQLAQKAIGPVDKEILGYIASNYSAVPYMNHEKLCYQAGCSSEELDEFLRSFGVEDLLSFNAILREVIYKDNDGPEELKDRTACGIADIVMQYEMANMTEFSASLDEDLLKRFVQDLVTAPEVYLITMRSAAPMTSYAINILSRVGIQARVIDTADNYVANVANMKRSGLVLAISHARYHKGTIGLMRHLRKNGYKIVSITDSPLSPAAKLSDYYFCCPQHSYDYTISFSTTNMLLNIVAIHIGLLDRNGLLNRFSQYAEITQSLEYYF